MSLNSSCSELTPAACRICLAVDVRLHTIAGTPLQLVYEKITNISLHSVDKRPVAACYICYALLYKSGKLMLTAAKAEKALTEVLEEFSKITTESISLIDREASGLSGSLEASGAEYFDNILPLKVENLDEIKTEPGLDDVSIEMEFEDSMGYPMSLPEDASNNNDETYDNTCEDKNTVQSLIVAENNEAPGDLLVEKKIQKGAKVVKYSVEKSSTSRKRKHSSGNPKKVTDEKKYACDDCQQTFRHERHLENHIKRRSCKKYQCDICQKQCKSSTDLKKHSRKHTDETPYECKICTMKFKTEGNLRRHVVTLHENNKFECNICQRTFDRKDYLKRHLAVHTNDKIYECSICKQQYKDQSNYNRHVKQHVKGESHECEICQMKFTLSHHLKMHLKKHTGVQRFMCEYCSISFKHQTNLVKHIMTHTGERPYECSVCKNRFNRRTHLRDHLKIHEKS